MSDTLKQRAFRKRNPEFEEAVSEIGHALNHAQSMLKAGKISKAEFADFEGLQYHRYIEALPVDEFHEMMKDGRLEQLQAMAGHDGTRDAYGVEKGRRDVENKIKSDALDEAWLDQRISSEHYEREMRDISDRDDKLDDRSADGDHDGVAAERFARRHDTPKDYSSDFEKIFAEYLPKGNRATAPIGDGRKASKPKPEPAKADPWEGVVDHDAED